MPRMKTDKIGMSLLDVLSNLFACAILLLLSVASTLGGKGQVDLPMPEDRGVSETLTLRFEEAPEHKNSYALTINLETKAEDHQQRIELEVVSSPGLMQDIRLSQGLYQPKLWQIFKPSCASEESWEVRLTSKESFPDSVFLNINIGTAPLRIPASNPRSWVAVKEEPTPPFLRIEERGENHPPRIFHYGTPIHYEI